MDFPHLKIQTKLSEAGKKYYIEIHNQVSSMAEEFLFETSRERGLCEELTVIFKEISQQPISRGSLREKARQDPRGR